MVNHLSLEEKFNICRSIGEECIEEEDLKRLLVRKNNLVAYDGFEPSGKMHLAQGILKVINVNKLTKCGFSFNFWIADWFAQLNDKMEGDIDKIRLLGLYFIEIWKAIGLKRLDTHIKFLFASEEINNKSGEYWQLVMDVMRHTSLNRMIKCCQIMGRSSTDNITSAQILYPAMQVADILFLNVDVCQLGNDQRKVNILAREYYDKIQKVDKPVILSHSMVPGLKEGQEKMSKSDPESSIYMDDIPSVVKTKIKKAYCPPKQIDNNPCIAYVKMLILPWFGKFHVPRKESHGGDVEYDSFQKLSTDYCEDLLHPGDLKNALIIAINHILEPVHHHFETDKNAKLLLSKIKTFTVK